MLHTIDIGKLGITVNSCQWFNGTMPLRVGLTYTAGDDRNALLSDGEYRFVLQTNVGTIPSTVFGGQPVQNIPLVTGYPNPIISGETLTVEGASKGDRIEIYNQAGFRVFSTKADGETTTVNVNLPTGTYTVRTDNGTVKIIVK